MRIVRLIDEHLEEYLLALLFIMLALVMFLQIIMRYVFGHSLPWPEEFCRYCFVFMTFLTLGYCTRRNSMLKLDIIKSLISSTIWKVLQVFVTLVTLAFYIVMLKGSLELYQMVSKTSRVSAALGVPYTVIYSSIVIGFFLALFRCVENLAKMFLKKDSKEG